MSECENIVWDGGTALEAVLIRHLLEEHPRTLTRADLQREVGHPFQTATEDEMEVAVRELAKSGLVEVEGSRVLPSRCAIRYFELTVFMA